MDTVADKTRIDENYAEKGCSYEGKADFLPFEGKFFHEEAWLFIIHVYERADWLGHFDRELAHCRHYYQQDAVV